MKVLLVGNYVNDEQESMQRFANLLQTGLRQAGHEVRLLRPTPFIGRIKPAAKGFGKWLGYVDKFVIFPRELKVAAKWADIVHVCDHSNALLRETLFFTTAHCYVSRSARDLVSLEGGT